MVVVRVRSLLLALGLGLAAVAQAPPPGPSEQALQAPFTLDDGKPTQGRAAASEPSGWRALGSTLLVGGLAVGGLWAFRRYGARRLPGAGGTRLKVEETLALGDRRFVSILRADDARFLLSVSPQGVTLLTRLDVDAEAPFADVLAAEGGLPEPIPVREMEARLREGRP